MTPDPAPQPPTGEFLETAALFEAIGQALSGEEVSDFMLSFPIVRAAADLKAEVAALTQERTTLHGQITILKWENDQLRKALTINHESRTTDGDVDAATVSAGPHTQGCNPAIVSSFQQREGSEPSDSHLAEAHARLQAQLAQLAQEAWDAVETLAHAGYDSAGVEGCNHCGFPYDGPHDEGCFVPAFRAKLGALLRPQEKP